MYLDPQYPGFLIPLTGAGPPETSPRFDKAWLSMGSGPPDTPPGYGKAGLPLVTTGTAPEVPIGIGKEMGRTASSIEFVTDH